MSYEESKVCSQCGQEKSILDFSRNGRRDGYRRPECRKCQRDKYEESENYEATVALRNKRRAELQTTPKPVLTSCREKLIGEDTSCTYCGKSLTMENSSVDHIIPLSRGGDDCEANMQIICRGCNMEKHAKTDDEYRSWLADQA